MTPEISVVLWFLLGIALARIPPSAIQKQITWPDTPFTTNGSRIKSASGQDVVYAGVNWPGAAATMLPEGLQYRSIADIVQNIKSLGMNVIRLTYAIEMVDDYLGNNPNQTLEGTLINALGSDNGTLILQDILTNNPQFNNATTRLQVFDAVAEECAKQQIWIHLDNHVSKAGWCCSNDDGNAWFGDTYFPVYNWQRGLGFMANYTKNWTALASMSLRNELRQPEDPGNSAEEYNWSNWYTNMFSAAQGIYDNNTLPLIFLSGINFDTDDTAILSGNMSSTQFFNVSNVQGGYGNKLVFEIHNYASNKSCNEMVSGLNMSAYNAMNPANLTVKNHAPVVMTEFGFDMNNGSSGGVYARCLKNFLPNQTVEGPGGWMQWVISGSYYIKLGDQDADEPFGLFNHDWSAWRNQSVIDNWLAPLINATLNPPASASRLKMHIPKRSKALLFA